MIIWLYFRVWECKNWTCDRWNTYLGHLQTSCWSPCGTVLLFVTSEETLLYCLVSKSAGNVFTHSPSPSNIATPTLDLGRVELPSGEVTGGLVQTMDWDVKGRHLAMIFKDTGHVAVFTTSVTPALQITPR